MLAYVYNSNEGAESFSATADYAPSLQSLDLIDPVQTPDQIMAVGGGSLDIVNGTLLRAETNPSSNGDGMVWVDTSSQIAKYLVRPGDTIGRIAGMYGVSAETILLHNALTKNDHIVAGDVLEILPIDGMQHIVTSGDKISLLAQDFAVTEEEIKTFNKINNDGQLTIGMSLIIPHGISKQTEKVVQKKNTSIKRNVTPDSFDLGPYQAPCDCIVTQGYGDTKFARASSHYTSHWHGGVDFSSSQGTGTPIVAIADGVVSKVNNSGYGGGYGFYIKIMHDTGVEALYAHNSKNIVTKGQKVKQGQIIGYMGTSGRVTGPHVHMELSKEGNPFYTTFQGSYGY